MKTVLLLMTLFVLSQPAFSLTNSEITGKALTDVEFFNAVENSIKGIFQDPSEVQLEFVSAGIVQQRAPHFVIGLDFYVKAGRVSMGRCSFHFLGKVLLDHSLEFVKLTKQDCGS